MQVKQGVWTEGRKEGTTDNAWIVRSLQKPTGSPHVEYLKKSQIKW